MIGISLEFGACSFGGFQTVIANAAQLRELLPQL